MTRIANWLSLVGLCALLIVTFLNLIEIILRTDFIYLLREHLPLMDEIMMSSGFDGLSDLYAPLGIVAVAFCFPSMLASRGTITVRFLVDTFPWRLRESLQVLGDFCLMVMFLSMAWWITDYTFDAWKSGETTWLIRIPRWPAWALATIALWVSAVIQSAMLYRQIKQALGREEPIAQEIVSKGAE